MYIIRFLAPFTQTYDALIKGNQIKEKQVKKSVRLLKQNPFYPSLKSHKVETKSFGRCWSSWVTGDLRIIWKFDEANRLIILLLAVAEHSGTHKEYK